MKVLSLDHMLWVATLLRRTAIVQNTPKCGFGPKPSMTRMRKFTDACTEKLADRSP